RTVQHEVAVAVGHVLADLVGRHALEQQLAHFLAQVDGEVGVRIGDRLVLADEAAQFAGDGQHAGLERRIGGRQVRRGRLEPRRGRGGGGGRCGRGDRRCRRRRPGGARGQRGGGGQQRGEQAAADV